MFTVQSVQRPAAAVRGSVPPGSPRRVAPLRLQQESLQKEKEEAQQKERERQAEEQEKEAQREEVSCLLLRLLPLRSAVTDSMLPSPGSEAAGPLRAAGEATERAQGGAEDDDLGSGSLHRHHSALQPQGSVLEQRQSKSTQLVVSSGTCCSATMFTPPPLTEIRHFIYS